MNLAVGFAVAAIARSQAAVGEWPFIAIRHTRYLNAAPDVFAKLVECHRHNPGACDEFWFSTGARRTIPEMRDVATAIASFRPLCDEIGVKLSLQQAVTLGHTKEWMDVDSATFAAVARAAADELDSQCRLAVQTVEADRLWSGKDFRPMLEALSGPRRASIGIRPGFTLRSKTDFDLACAGIPVTVAESGTKVWYIDDKSRAEMTEAACRPPRRIAQRASRHA